MNITRSITDTASLIALLTLSACGGAGTGGAGFTPTPAPSLTPPTSKNPAFLPSESGQLATFGYFTNRGSNEVEVGDDTIYDPDSDWFYEKSLTLRYDAAADKLYATPPGETREIELVHLDGGDQYGSTEPGTTILAHAGWLIDNDNKYAQVGNYFQSYVSGSGPRVASGAFVFGGATPADQIPVTGSASYAATVYGETELIPLAPPLPEMADSWSFGPPVGDDYISWIVTGTADFSVDFASGALSGQLNPSLYRGYNCTWDYCENYTIDLPSYAFADVQLTVDRNSFVGQFMVPNLGVDGLLQGGFFGPNAVEIGGSFHAPFQYPPDGQWYQMGGLFIGKRD